MLAVALSQRVRKLIKSFLFISKIVMAKKKKKKVLGEHQCVKSEQEMPL